ncbi:unnamed protein product [Lampetra fluviatilis]
MNEGISGCPPSPAWPLSRPTDAGGRSVGASRSGVNGARSRCSGSRGQWAPRYLCAGGGAERGELRATKGFATGQAVRRGQIPVEPSRRSGF